MNAINDDSDIESTINESLYPKKQEIQENDSLVQKSSDRFITINRSRNALMQ